MSAETLADKPAETLEELDRRQRATFRRLKRAENRLRRLEECLQIGEIDPMEGRIEDEYDGQ